MSSTKNSEESAYIRAMGEELGEIFYALSQELIWVHWCWKQYRILFGEKPTRINLLNESAPLFFHIVHRVFFEDTLLAIARLVGSSKSVGKPNLAISRLPPLLLKPELRQEVDHLVGKAQTSAEFAVDWRNRRLAHRDLDLSLGRSLRPLDVATRDRVEEALAALRNVLNHIELNFCRATTAYATSAVLGDATELLYVIRDGLQRRDEKHARLAKGELNDEDLKLQEPV